MSKEILKGIFEENIAPVREDITFEGWVDKIRDNEEYKVGLFENYVQPSMPEATFEEFNSNAFGSLGKVEAPLAGAQSEESFSPTESVSSEFEVGPPAGGTPPGVEPKGAPVAEAAALVGEVGSEGEPTIIGQELDPYTIVEEDDRNFFERLFGEERYRRVTERAVETIPALTRLFGKAAAKDVQEEINDLGRAMEADPEFVIKASQNGLFTTNNLATYLSQEAAGDKKGAEEINMFLEKGATGKTTQFERFKTLYAPIEKERNEAIQKELLSNRDYVALRGKIDAEFNSQRVGVDEKYDFKALMGEEFKVGEKELLGKYESATLALPMQLETKASELKFDYQTKVNNGQMGVNEANEGLKRDLDAYGAELQKQSDEALGEYNSGVSALAERVQKGVKDKPEFKAYMDELNDLRNGVVESFSGDYQKIQQAVFNNIAPKYNSKIESAITNSMKGETPLLNKSGVKGNIDKILGNRGWDYLPFDQKKAALDTMFGTALSKLKRSGVQINDGVVAGLRAEFDDAFMDRAYFTKKGTPSLFMVKTRAIEEAERLDEMLKEREAKTGTKTYTSGIYGSEFGVGGMGYDDTDVQELRLAREKLQEIIEMPETMSDNEWSNFWNGLTSGKVVDYLPFVSGLKNLSGTLALYRAVGKDTESARYLKNAEALNSTYKNMYEVNNMASDWYRAGRGTAESLPFMMEFAATAGIGSGVRIATEKVAVKLLGKQAETMVGKSFKVLAGTLVSSLAQTTLNPQRYVDETLKRMTPQMTIAFSPEGDDLVAMLDSSDAEGGFEAALKGFGVTASEYFSEGLGFAGARAMKALGSKMLQNEFLKKAYVGWYMSKFNLDTPTAFKKIAEMGGWNGFLMEFGEELVNIPLTNLITGDAKVMEGIIKDGEFDTENLADIARTLLPISLAGGSVSLGGLAINKIAPEGVTVTYRDINNLPTTETINKGVWDAVTEVMKSPSKVRDFIANELPKLKVDGKGRELVTSMLERSAIEFDRGVVGVGTRQVAEATSPLEVTFEPIPETGGAPKVEIIAKRRQKLNKDRTKLVPTGGFDYFAKVGDREVKLSDAEYKAYKDSGVLPESVSAVEATPKVEGEAVTPEAVSPEVPALRDVESTAEALEGVNNKNPQEIIDASKKIDKVEYIEEGEAREIIESYTHYKSGNSKSPATRWAGWFQSINAANKKFIVEDIQNDPKLRNAMLSLFFDVYKSELNFKGSFDDFLNTEITLYRGVTLADKKGVGQEGFSAFSTTKNRVSAYADEQAIGKGQVKEIKIKPIDTYGAVNYIGGGEIEVLVPTEFKNETIRQDFIRLLELNIGLFSEEQTELLEKYYDKEDYISGLAFIKSIISSKPKQLSEAYHKAKEDGSNPELVSAVEELLGKPTQTPEVAEGQPAEVISPEVAEVLSTEDTTRIALESLEVLPEGIESAEEGARIYHEAIGKEERTEAEDAVVMAVEDAVIGGAVVPEVETPEAVETAETVTPEEVSTEGVTPEVPGVVEAAEGQRQPSRVATFFSGAGTMEASLPNAQSVMAVEFNPAYVEAYNKAFGVEYEAKDVRDINPEEVIASKPDIFHASPVCKNFSAAKNKRTVLKSDMESADAVARVIREAQPPIVTIENVPDYQGTVPFETIVKALEDAGYTFDVGVYNSADFGGVQNRERLLIRAVKSGELPPIQEKTAPGDWYSAIEDLIEGAPDSKFESRSESENWEMTRIKDMVRKGKLDATKPIITMGGSASSGVAAAANAGGPAPTLLSTSRSVPRIILPDGTVKRVTPEMMRRLMGLPESYPIPSNPKIAKEVLGNGVDGAFTRALIDPLLNRAETQPSAEAQPSAEGLTSKEKAEQANKRAEEIAEKIRKNLRGRGGITGITPFSRAKRLAEVDRATLALIKDYIYQKVLAGAYTFKDFVEDMKENSKRIFGVQIEVANSDKSIFHSAQSRFEINDAFAQEILDLKDDFLFSIAAMSGRMNMNFQEFISSNSALVNGFVNRAESIYGLDDQAMMLVQEMYQDALRAAANRAESYTTLEDVKKFHETKEELLGLERDMERARINEEIKRRRNWLSRNFDKFQRAFITPVKNFNRAFGYRAGKFSDYRTSQERDVYSARKYRMGASTKAGNWYNAIHNKIYGGLSWFEKVELDKYLIYRRIVEVSEVRNQRAAEYKKLEAELAAGVTPVRKQEIKEAMAELEKAGMGEVKSGSIMVDGKKEEYTVALAEAFVNDINARNDALAIKIRNRAEMYTEANNELLKMRLDSGEISQEAYDSMQKRDYVRRLFVDLSNTTLDEANYSPVSKEIKAIKEGSEDAILEMDTQALLQINAQITFDSVAKNNFIKKVVGWSEAKQQDYLDKALEKFKDARARTERYLRSSPRPLTQDEIDRFIKEQTLFIPLSNDAKVPSGFTAQKYFVDGVEKRVAVRNDIANIFQTPSGRGINENSFAIKAISALLLTPVIKASAVFVNPAFAIGNFALDVIHASMVTRDLYKSFTFNLGTILAKATGYTAENIYRKAVKYGASLFGRTARDSKFERLVKDYFEHGGGMSGLSNPSSRMYSDKLSSSALRRSFGDAMDGIIAVLDVINSLQSGSELITRVIVYEAALDKNIAAYREKNGVDPVGEDLALMKMSAAASSADLIDFREGAEATKAFDQTLLPFLNAMIQGAKAEIDFASKNPLLAAARLAEFGGMALGAALYNANSGDEDEKEGIVGYNGITDYIKSNFFVMMMPWTKKNERGEIVRPFISIKLPAALKATNILVSGMVADQGAENTIGQMASALEGGYVPEIGSVSPTAQIFMALNYNRDAFRKGAPVYRGRADVLLTERFNAGETKAIYRDLFGAMYDLINEDGENEGVLGFDEAGPAQWQAAFEKAISSNNPYYLGITSTYATISSLYGKDNKKEVDALMDEKFAALNAFGSRVYREPNSSVQQKNMKDRKQVDFLRDQIGSWQKKNDDAIEFAAKTIRDINKLEGNSKNVKIDLFFDREVFNYISDAQMIKGIKDQGIKDIPENLDDLNKVINKEQTRLSLRLLEEFKPNFVFKHPALKSYAQSEDSYVGLNAEMINKIAKEYDSSRNRRSYLIALKFVAGDDFKNIVQQIGAHERDLSVVEGITETTSATKYKRLYLRPDNRSSKPISSESAINNLILLKYLLTNE
jgi:DNA-cytosine methyltransferase